MANARTTALSAIIAGRKSGAWSDGALKEYIARDGLDKRDAALASTLCYGVLQSRMLLDHYLTAFLNGKLRDLQPIVLDILRLGAYQILMMDRIPDSAAVNEAVNQCKSYANKKASGLVNGVLRNLSRQKDNLSQPEDLATRYSHPEKLVALLAENVGTENLEGFLAADNEPSPLVLQCNPLVQEPEKTRAELEAQGIVLSPHEWLADCYYAQGIGSLEALAEFKNGSIYVQDAAAKLAAIAAGVHPGMQVLDVCAAPGGKSFAAAMAMQNRGSIVSCDIHKHKISLIEKGAERLHISIIKAMEQDACARRAEWVGKMDAVIADVVCSGLGVIRKKPDIRYKDIAQTEKLPEIQSAILENVSAYVKPGGVLLYSTCTVLRRENEDVVRAFLSKHPEFSAEEIEVPAKLTLTDRRFVTLLPNLHHTDGFFICRLRKNQ